MIQKYIATHRLEIVCVGTAQVKELFNLIFLVSELV